MPHESQAVRERYRHLARHYDVTANLYYLIGYREWAYRTRAVAALGLAPGDTVVEVCCGTGLNFPMLRDAVGDSGRIIGVDLTDAMLAGARLRVEREGWRNVELVESDAAEYTFPPGVAGILSTFALSLVPAYDDVVRRGAEALRPGGRWVVLDLTVPRRLVWLSWLYLLLTGAFGSTLEAARRDPAASLYRHLGNARRKDMYFGFTYLAVAERMAGQGAVS